MTNMMIEKVGIAGMSHLGQVWASALHGKRQATVCYDPQIVKWVKEPGVRPFEVRTDPAHLRECSVVYVTQDVDDHDDLGAVKSRVSEVFRHLAPSAILVLLSQVPPGFTRSLACYYGDRLFNQMDNLIFGQAFNRASLPEQIVIGALHPEDGLPKSLEHVLAPFVCSKHVVGYEDVELAKVSINCLLVAQISMTHSLARLAAQEGCDWQDIKKIVASDKRIGSYLNTGLGIGGGHMLRDLRTVASMVNEFSPHALVWEANKVAFDWLYDKTRYCGKNVAIWGLSYKAGTDSIKDALSIALIAARPNTSFHVHDPVQRDLQFKNVHQHDDAIVALQQSDSLIIASPWYEYHITAATIAKHLSGKLLIDPYRVIDADEARLAGLQYVGMGYGKRNRPDPSAAK